MADYLCSFLLVHYFWIAVTFKILETDQKVGFEIVLTLIHWYFFLEITAQDSTVVNSSNYKKRSATCEDPFKPAKILREGSVLDILKTPGKWVAALVKISIET